MINKFLLVAAASLMSLSVQAGSLYLPLQLSPEIEHRIDRLFVQAKMPQVKKPIPVKLVHQALSKVEKSDPVLASAVRAYIERYRTNVGITHLDVTLSTSDGADYVMANQRGYSTHRRYQASINAYWAISDMVAVNVGGIIGERDNLEGEFPDGTFLSVGSDWLQADIGYRAHWWSPTQDSAMLIGTQASAMPGITLSNVMPISSWGLSYEVFMEQMSESDEIKSANDPNQRLTGNARLFGLHLGASPFEGFNIGMNRLMQYGGADRDDSFSSLISAFFQPGKKDNSGVEGSDFGNQLTAFTVSYAFDHGMPIGLSMEYAGEDTSQDGRNGMIGNTSLILGINLPRITDNIGFSWEHGEWQNAWYINNNYGDGLSNHDAIIGHWGAEQRQKNDAVGAVTDSLKLNWQLRYGTELNLGWRQINNNDYSATNYQTGQDAHIELSQAAGSVIFSLALNTGQTVYGEEFSRITGAMRW